MGVTEQPAAAAAFDQKLRNKMLLRVLGTAAVILLVLGVVTFLSARSLLAEELKQKSRSKVEYAATVIDAWLHEKGEVLSILADREARQAMPDELKQGYFRDVAAQYGGFESVYMGFEADGGFVTGADWVPPADYDPRQRPWYTAAVAARGVAYSAPYRDMFTNRIVVSVAAPVYDDGHLRGVMAMDIFVDDILGVVDSLRVGRSGHAFVVDGEGTFVAHPDPAQVLVGTIARTGDAALFDAFRKRATRTTSEVYEAEDYVTIGHIAENDWHVVFHLPFDEVSRPLRTLALIFFGGIIAALLVLAFTINYISHNIARPILKLVDGARDISGGEYERSLPVESRDEVGYLTQSFNEMALGLKDREFIKSTFGRYVSPDVMREILAGNVALGGEAKVISVMFCDIRGFTTLSENMGPHELVTLLNRYFTRMDRVISAHGGFINKYLGDGILAMFGAPVALESSAQSAVEAAYAMLEQLAEFNQHRGLSLQVGI
ncbi:MAG TPA: cache domain-containing protein, partial [Kofleriaceae bacterium]|nr:cache domain-containing protein [Kofleriaceae bacterium]